VVVRNAGLSSVDPRMAMLSQQELHVRQRDLEAARALLTEGAVVPADALGDGSLLGTCPLHERPARAQCQRCGTFLCERCQTASTPPVCEDCVAQAGQVPARPPRRSLQRAVAVLLLLPTGLTLLGLLALALRRLLP
jgi:hypothetical protein